MVSLFSQIICPYAIENTCKEAKYAFQTKHTTALFTTKYSPATGLTF